MASAQLTDIELAHALVALQSPVQMKQVSGSGRTKAIKAWISHDFRKLRWLSRWRRTDGEERRQVDAASDERWWSVNISDMISLTLGCGDVAFRCPQLSFHIQFSTSACAAATTRSDSPSTTSVSYSVVSEVTNTKSTLSLVLACKSRNFHASLVRSFHAGRQRITFHFDENDWIMWTAVLQGLYSRTICKSVLDKARDLFIQKQNSCSSSKTSRFHDDVCQVYSWGDGSWGATAHGDLCRRTKPEIVKGAVGKGIAGVSCGWAHTVFLMESGEIWASGHSLGTGFANDVCVLIKLALTPSVSIVQVVCGSFHCLARSFSNGVLSWGANNYGQLGLGDYADRSSPTPIKMVQNAVAIACGSNASACIDPTGSVYTFGQSDSGFTGHGHDSHLPNPTPVSTFGPSNPALLISCGANHMVAVTKDSIYSWGWNACGQLGHGHTNDIWAPAEAVSITGLVRGSHTVIDDAAALPSGIVVVDLSCGAAHSALILHDALRDQYSLYTWGLNSHGQCALPSVQYSPCAAVPTLVTVPFSQATMLFVTCGAHHTLLQTKEHGLFSAGCNDYGQLGIDSLSKEPVHELLPCRVLSKGIISQVASGATHCCIILSESWIDDSDCITCMTCKSPFTSFRRRHHCRSCGGVFCTFCSENRLPILRKGLTSPVRVCDACYAKFKC